MIQPIAKNPSGLTRDQERIQDDRAVVLAWRALKREVEYRDGPHCRCCGRRCRFDAQRLSEKADPHHIIFQSAGGPDTVENVIKLCRWCHDEVHVHRRIALSGDANQQDEFGRYRCVQAERLAEGGYEPWKLI